MAIFKNILKDVFANLPESPFIPPAHSARSRGFDIEAALEKKALEKGLVPHKPWINKCMQLFNISHVHHGKASC